MDIETIQIMLTKTAVLAPIIVGVVQVVKITGMPARFVPLSAIVIGCAFGYVFVGATALGGLAGIALGLSSIGLYEVGKKTVQG